MRPIPTTLSLHIHYPIQYSHKSYTAHTTKHFYTNLTHSPYPNLFKYPFIKMLFVLNDIYFLYFAQCYNRYWVRPE